MGSSVIYKLYTRMLEKKLRKVIENKQACFRTGSQTQDHIFTLNLYLAFLDLRAAFDSVPRKYLWEALIKKKVPYELIKIIKSLYGGIKGVVRTEG
ncbi:hypothetical protein J437_LFUL001053 [Ladona fulva]|uniref:Reverse transcriptase domain-containing protein n=1 Tax=Ladona fulva TaxID=123851 RepID=A0A8K0K7L4_LADFU|nr:hypothetical protein J437_LFUL001053 [Ladona fulva]